MEGRFFEVGRLRCVGVGGEVAIAAVAEEVDDKAVLLQQMSRLFEGCSKRSQVQPVRCSAARALQSTSDGGKIFCPVLNSIECVPGKGQ